MKARDLVRVLEIIAPPDSEVHFGGRICGDHVQIETTPNPYPWQAPGVVQIYSKCHCENDE
jgi:hypothetical protein